MARPKKIDNAKAFTMYMDSGIMAKAKARAEGKKQSMSEFIRDAVKAHLKLDDSEFTQGGWEPAEERAILLDDMARILERLRELDREDSDGADDEREDDDEFI